MYAHVRSTEGYTAARQRTAAFRGIGVKGIVSLLMLRLPGLQHQPEIKMTLLILRQDHHTTDKEVSCSLL